MKFLLSVLLVVASLAATAQRLDSASISKLPLQKQAEINAYLQEAKRAKTTALLLCLGGGSITVAGLAYSMAYDISHDYYTYDNDLPSYNNGTKAAILGAMVGLSSIPFFIKSHNKRDEARAILYADKSVSLAPNVTMPGTQSAGARLVIPLGR